MDKYVEPSGYFNAEMRKILEKGKKTSSKNTGKSSVKSTTKKSK